MRLINVEAFLQREGLMKERKPVDRRTEVLEFGDDEATEYAILSHRWMAQEVDYDDMVGLAKMDWEERDEIRRGDGYRKIIQSCEQAQKDGYKWLWADTCCIDKRSSAELSEAINSMYRWYENAEVCYAYLHDVPSSSFPTVSDEEKYPGFNGWPEWFSRGWTLQELIAPSNVQFFNKDWQSIGGKRMHARTLVRITGIPEYILIDGRCGNRPCVAQIMSWAADRTTTRVEDRAYSLMGLLDVNMPMLYGEGKKAFHRLQLEVIRASNDQSIFAWSCNSAEARTGSILADDPSKFRDCGEMELMAPDEFIQSLKKDAPEEALDSIEDRLGTFPITNRGIQIWMLLRPRRGSHTLFEAWLPCRREPWRPPVTIDLVLWDSNYYRWPALHHPLVLQMFSPPSLSRHNLDLAPDGPLQFCQVYLKYQDLPHRNTTFEVGDSSLLDNDFTCCGANPMEFTGANFTLITTASFRIKIYSDSLSNHCLVVGFGESFGKDWIHVVSEESDMIPRHSWKDYTWAKFIEMLVRTPEYAQQMNEVRSGAERYGQVCIMQTHLPRKRILQISSVVWKSSRVCGVKLEVFHDPGVGDVSGRWTAFDVEGTDDPSCDWRGLMVLDQPRKDRYEIDGVIGSFSAALGIKLGDYGRCTDSGDFCREGNLLAGLKSLPVKVDITGYSDLFSMGVVMARNRTAFGDLDLYKPLMLSLPSNDDLKSLLTSLSTSLTNRYLVTRIIQCPDPRKLSSNITTPLYNIAKPFVWHQNKSAGSVSEERSGDGLRGETQGDQVRVNDVDEIKS